MMGQDMTGQDKTRESLGDRWAGLGMVWVLRCCVAQRLRLLLPCLPAARQHPSLVPQTLLGSWGDPGAVLTPIKQQLLSQVVT